MEVAVGAPDRPIWAREFRGVVAPRASVDRRTGRWHLLGTDVDGLIVHAEGTIGRAAVDERRWRGPVGSGYVHPVAVDEDKSVVLVTRYDTDFLADTSLWQWWLLLSPGFRAATDVGLWTAAGNSQVGASRLDLNCHPLVVDSRRGLCSAFDGFDTRIVTLDAASGRVLPLAAFDGQFVPMGSSQAGWIEGWWQSAAVALRLDTRDLFQVDPGAASWVIRLAAGDTKLAALVTDGDSYAVQVYDLPAAPQSSENALSVARR
jgi:hypothetical protein